MTHYYGIGTTEQMTMAEIGEKMNLKRERVRQIRKTAERKMRRIMKK
jgi:RNA polymerase primary sigma factor